MCWDNRLPDNVQKYILQFSFPDLTSIFSSRHDVLHRWFKLIQSPTDFTIESCPRHMHHAPLPCVVCLTLHRFTKIAERFQTEITTIYSELHTFTSRAQKQHIASLVCITFSYHVCFPFDAHIHYLTIETVQPSSHFQFVQHELTSNNHQQYLPVLHSGLLSATNQLSTGIK